MEGKCDDVFLTISTMSKKHYETTLYQRTESDINNPYTNPPKYRRSKQGEILSSSFLRFARA